jgi:ribosomal protein S18 acetylase RimI-like enzyme
MLIKELKSKTALLSAFPLINQLYPNMTKKQYSTYLEEMIERNDFKMIAGFEGKKIVGIAGYWISRMLYCGRYLQISSFAVDKTLRNSGIGKEILEHLEIIAKKHKCDKIALDSYTENRKAHTLFYRHGFYIRGFHFLKDLETLR